MRFGWLRHAFAVDPAGPAEPTPEQQTAVDWVCRQVAKRHLTTPGLLALEMARPMNYISAQAMHFVSPAVWALAPVLPARTHEHYTALAEFLERRGSIEYMARRIEHFEQEFSQREKPGRDDGNGVGRRPPGEGNQDRPA